MFLLQLTLLRDISEKWLSRNLHDRCFKLFLNRIHILKQKVPAVEKKHLWLVLSSLGTKSLQTRTKLQKSIKGLLNCCKLKGFFLRLKKTVIIFPLKNLFPKFLLKFGLYVSAWIMQWILLQRTYKRSCCNAW